MKRWNGTIKIPEANVTVTHDSTNGSLRYRSPAHRASTFHEALIVGFITES